MGASNMHFARSLVSRAAPQVTRRCFAAEASSARLNFSLVLPDRALYEKADVDLVIVPASNGAFGIMKDHVPTIAQLDAGLLTVHNGSEEDKYFVSGGFAIVKEDGADVCAVEAVRVEDLDSAAVNSGLTAANAKLAAAKDDLEKAEAQISISTYLAMQGAIGSK